MGFFKKDYSAIQKAGKEKQKAVEKVFSKLKSEPWIKDLEKKEQILTELQLLGDEIFDVILKLSKDESPNIRKEAYIFIGGLAAIEAKWLIQDEKLEDILIQALGNESDELRMEVVRALALIEEKKRTGKAIPLLIDVLKNDTDINIRAETARYLAFISRTQSVVEALLETLKEKVYFSYSSTHLVTRLIGGFLGLDAASTTSLQVIAAMCLANLGITRQVVEDYFENQEKLLDWEVPEEGEISQKPEQVARDIITYCEENKIGESRYIEQLIINLKSPDVKTKKGAAEILGTKHDIKTVNALIDAMCEFDLDLMETLRNSLVKIGDLSVEPLKEALLTHPDYGVRVWSAEVLGSIGNISAKDALLKSMEDNKWAVRRAAKGALKKIEKQKKADRSQY